MIRFEFGVEDLARARFAISPMLELVNGLRVIRDPGHAAMHVPWVRAAVPIARRLRLATVFALAPPTGFVPNFLTPPPTSPVVSFEDELERVRRTEAEQIGADVRAALAGRRPSGRVRELLEDPAAGLAALTDALERFWHEALADHWPRIRALLEADIAHRAQRLTTGGPVDLFADLHPDARWIGGHLEVAVPWAEDVDLRGRSLVLVPSAMHWWRPACIVDSPWQPTLVYPARGLALLWQASRRGDGALGAVVGRTRATLLAALDAPRSTTELASALGLSAGGVSAHLTALRNAGLVSSTRHGHSVLYARTPIADQLLTPQEGAETVPS
jgi:DNA-binding transcriptional ArsR family regulator